MKQVVIALFETLQSFQKVLIILDKIDELSNDDQFIILDITHQLVNFNSIQVKMLLLYY